MEPILIITATAFIATPLWICFNTRKNSHYQNPEQEAFIFIIITAKNLEKYQNKITPFTLSPKETIDLINESRFFLTTNTEINIDEHSSKNKDESYRNEDNLLIRIRTNGNRNILRKTTKIELKDNVTHNHNQLELVKKLASIEMVSKYNFIRSL